MISFSAVLPKIKEKYTFTRSSILKEPKQENNKSTLLEKSGWNEYYSTKILDNVFNFKLYSSTVLFYSNKRQEINKAKHSQNCDSIISS